MGLKPGDEFEIKLGYKHIHLIQVDPDKKEVQPDLESELDEEDEEYEDEEYEDDEDDEDEE